MGYNTIVEGKIYPSLKGKHQGYYVIKVRYADSVTWTCAYRIGMNRERQWLGRFPGQEMPLNVLEALKRQSSDFFAGDGRLTWSDDRVPPKPKKATGESLIDWAYKQRAHAEAWGRQRRFEAEGAC